MNHTKPRPRRGYARRALGCVLLAALLFSVGCRRGSPARGTDETALRPVEPVGRVPAAFRRIVEENAFHGATAFGDRLLKSELISSDDAFAYQITMIDLDGETLASYTAPCGEAYFVETLIATADGGFLFVLGFTDHLTGEDGVWASDDGFASHVVKCDRFGAVQFDVPIEGAEASALAFCIEKDGAYYLFGETQSPLTRKQGVWSPTDICVFVLSPAGELLRTLCIGGSDYDNLYNAEALDGGFLLSVSSQSCDGDFAGSGSGGNPVAWTLFLNDALEIAEKKKENGRSPFVRPIGLKDGAPVYPDDPMFDGLNAGTPTAFIEYDGFDLVVSEAATGIYENQPLWLSSIWYEFETVYSAYRKNGKLLFRASVDSSPDYDVMAADAAREGF